VTAGLQFDLEEKVLRMHFEYKLLWYKKIAIFNAEVWPVELASEKTRYWPQDSTKWSFRAIFRR